ncbi:MAG: hypothetical protein ABSH41_17595 [Syntrophobacteraceae bacterium]
MEFYLHYRGPLKANGNPTHKQEIRRHFHQQLKELWSQKPLASYQAWLTAKPDHPDALWFLRLMGVFTFVTLVTEHANLIAELSITLLRPEAPGSIITQSGDIDNRLKTLFDALRKPHTLAELPPGDEPGVGEDKFFCLLEDDNLISHVTIKTDRLLEQVTDQSEVLLLIAVKTRVTRATWGNMGLGV